MGIRTRLMSGGRTVLASMSVGSEPFETLGRAVRVDDVVFSTVGQDRIKCLRPRLLFALPLLRVVNCRDAKAIEARIRTAWRQHLDELRASQRWGQSMNAEMGISEDGSLLSLTISGENRPARAYVCKPRTVILPGRGPLSGVALGRAEDRLHEIEPGIHSSVDLDISISNRIEELIRIDRRLEAERRRQAVREAEGLLGRSATQRSHRLLLVGPQIANERRCIDSLKLRSYEVDVASNPQEAISIFEHGSPELVIADMSLGRSEGIELIPALREIVGIEEVPVILIDTHKRPSRRQAAQRAGAAGYLSYPVDVSRIAERLEKMVNEPRRRRFTRYPQQLSARLAGAEKPCTATMLNRGGIFLNTRENLPDRSLHELRVTLHEIGKSIKVEAEVLYQMDTAGRDHRGVGLRFHSFPDTAEETLLINYLQELEQPYVHP
ncbi:MAG: response regulator [Deltaproteobacteria bacterium]|nr:response regulator [Deltaproteobacteria bacterium]MBW2416959.1 response regulator [Deltaproteobacteria bacterium]